MVSNNTPNYIEQGGGRTVIRGSLDVASGGDLDMESGSTLRIAGTALTATAAQVNRLTVTTAGTVEASKVVVVGASRDVDFLMATSLRLDATTLTVTGAQLNRAAVTTTGTVEASKVVVVGANKEIDTLVIADSGLKLGAGAGTAVTATAAQLNRAAVTTVGVLEASKVLVVDATKKIDTLDIATPLLNGTTVTITAANLNKAVVSTGAGIAITGGEVALTGTVSFNTGLNTVNAVQVSMVSTQSVTDGYFAQGYKGATAGWVIVQIYKPTAANNVEPTAGTASQTAAWIAVGQF